MCKGCEGQGGKGRRVVKRQGGRSLVLFKVGNTGRVPDFIFLFLMLISHGTKEQDSFKIIRRGQRDGSTLLRSNTSC